MSDGEGEFECRRRRRRGWSFDALGTCLRLSYYFVACGFTGPKCETFHMHTQRTMSMFPDQLDCGNAERVDVAAAVL